MTSETKGLLPEPEWYGLVVDNRQLFDALQDGWLRPVAPQTGLLVGVDSFVREPDQAPGNRIPIRVRFDTAKLPDLAVNVFRGDHWCSLRRSHVMASDPYVYWPGVLPTSAIRDLSVASDEHRIRLLSMARRASNIAVPDVLTSDIAHDPGGETLQPPTLLPETAPGIAIPAAGDAIRGAMTMALWAVPRIDPWLDVLTASLSGDAKRLADAVQTVEASWWRFPPWARSMPSHEASVEGAEERLWLAAIEAFGAAACPRPSDATDRIAQIASRSTDHSNEKHLIDNWRRHTHRVLRADASIQHDDWRRAPVGIAIQLVLTRPEPANFKTWLCDDNVHLPPAVAWTAATLCGLFHGYRRLDIGFRGSASQQEVVAVRTLHVGSDDARLQWPDLTDDAPSWRRESGEFVLTWGGRDFARKREKERGQWYAANLSDPVVQRDAIAVTKRFDWPCLARVMKLDEGRRRWDGPGSLESRERTLRVRGRVRVRLLPGDDLTEEVDHSSFLRILATEPGRPPAPPVSGMRERSTADLPGFSLIPNFLTEVEEDDIVAEIDRSPWSSELRRRVQHYGWRYDYGSKQVHPTMHIGPLPDWAKRIAQQLFESGHVPELPDQVIVNEYVQDQGIASHIDSPSSFADGVAMISLLETWEMEFRKPGTKAKVTRRLERRSAAVLTGEARYEWRHGLPHRKTEPPNESGNGKRRRVPRGRRISLTFRKVIGARSDARPKGSSSSA